MSAERSWGENPPVSQGAVGGQLLGGRMHMQWSASGNRQSKGGGARADKKSDAVIELRQKMRNAWAFRKFFMRITCSDHPAK